VPGTEWGAAIIAGIDACKVMVLIFSSSANESPQVRREVERAIRLDRRPLSDRERRAGRRDGVRAGQHSLAGHLHTAR